MIIHRAGSRPSTRPSADYFTGIVRMEPLISAPDHPSLRGVTVTFEPGARTNWHTHPQGQTLIVTAGAGLAQTKDGPLQQIYPGDVIHFPAGEKHWHGATPTTAMTHIALQQEQEGSTATWLEPVTDTQYNDT
ncbi:MAG: cupin domain-containing protein [Sulfitobacter sp.]